MCAHLSQIQFSEIKKISQDIRLRLKKREKKQTSKKDENYNQRQSVERNLYVSCTGRQNDRSKRKVKETKRERSRGEKSEI